MSLNYFTPFLSRFRLGLTLAVVLAASGNLAVAEAAGVATETSWPMYRGQPSLSGVSPASLEGNLKEAWVFKAEWGIKSSAAIVGGQVFIGCDDGHLFALDLETGEKKWAFKTEGAVESSPLVLGDGVFVGSADGALYHLSVQDGSVRWKYQTDDQILGAPNWYQLTDQEHPWIIVGSYDFRLHCIRSNDGSKVWDYETGNYINGSPAISQGKTVFGGCDALLHVIDLKDGSKTKEIDA